MNNRSTQYASRAAILTGIFSIFGFITLMLFFALEAPSVGGNPDGFHFWGFLSDVAAPLTMIPLLVVMLALHQAEKVRAASLSRAAFLIGVIGALAQSVLQILLVIKVLTFEQEVGPVVLAMGLVGVWLVLANHMGRVQHILPSGLAWLGIAVGAAQAFYPVLFQVLGGADFYSKMGTDYLLMALTGVIFLFSYIGFPAWAFWFARVWSSKQVPAKAEVVYVG